MKILVADYLYKDIKDHLNNFVKNPDDIIVVDYQAFDLFMNAVTTSYILIIEDYTPNYPEMFKDFILDKENL